MKSTFTINKLDCQSCAMVIEGICEDMNGVQRAEVNAAKRSLTVEHDDSVSPTVVQQALDKEGYPVELAK